MERMVLAQLEHLYVRSHTSFATIVVDRLSPMSLAGASESCGMGYAVDLIYADGDARIISYDISAKTEAEAIIEARRWLASARSMARMTDSPEPVAFTLLSDGEVVDTSQVGASGKAAVQAPLTDKAPRSSSVS